MKEIEWEYETFVDTGLNPDFDIDDWLNSFGGEGWELVTMVPKDYRSRELRYDEPAGAETCYTFVFKRPVDRS